MYSLNFVKSQSVQNSDCEFGTDCDTKKSICITVYDANTFYDKKGCCKDNVPFGNERLSSACPD